ncbi:MAG: diaminobutyrate acetyltransferase [Dehalococcoidia bacterium]
MDITASRGFGGGGGKPEEITFRVPTVADGAAMWRLARDSDGLEVNSPYSYLMVCRHFPGTCVIAESKGEAIGFISGHSPNAYPDVVFVWQIAVAKEHRGKGLALEMLTRLLQLPGCSHARYLEATVTPSNEASRRTFRALARRLGVTCTEESCFPSELFPETAHEDEQLFRIGPIQR